MNVTALYYTAEGRVTCIKNIQESTLAANAAGGESWFILESHIRHEDVYIADGVIVTRPVMPLVVSPLNFDVSGSLTVTGIPVGTTLTYPGGSMVIDDGFFEWDTTLAGTYLFKLENFPFMEENFSAQVS